ncbi:hypothetical protein I302_108831 [Kwoniella bestiolae CBS 10118]|uniref:SCP domain-containing protein n=1 Tax=Kwoniella bestiolae CBS 10118 TaxID=1296100 RepID=A0A1B9FU69_9TREE|nr:hypothetical protein I302_07970 [Kwoniella bestiolae CBS 10118]OCF22323.1 hypothetical protein I302_07970 [Kwoniella bestiolae CBS 10118]
MLRLTSSLLFALLSVSVHAAPHCRPHQNHTVSTVTQWYTRHHAQSTTVLPTPTSTSTSIAEVVPSASTGNGTSLVIEDPSASAEPTFVEVTSTSSTSEAPVPTSVESVSSQVETIPESSTSAIAAVPTNLAAQPTNSTSSESGTSDPDADLLVKLHNDFRAQYGAGPVTWSTTLADYAKSHATACDMQHTNGPYGENLAAGAGGGYSITDGFNAWAAEAPEYDPNNPQYSHFTQVVWKSTTEIGCAAVTCADGTIFSGVGSDSLYIMCEYNPPGNYIGQFGENVGSKTS